ncbi:MAG: family beta-propeller repeat protein [Cyanobacteria bacterium RYN_339]|nr:family beta-propeller repeat protein [Cyanobacteria bacterium RYN_339]
MNRIYVVLPALFALCYGVFAYQQAHALKPAKKLWVTSVLEGVTVIDLQTGRRKQTIETGILPHNILLSPDGKKVYVTNVGSQSISELDVETEKKTRDMLVGEIPDNAYHRKLGAERMGKATSCFECHHEHAIGSLPNAITWDGEHRALIVNEVRKRAVTWVDAASGKTTKTIPFEHSLPDPSTPANILVHPFTHEIWVLHRWEKADYKKGGPLGAHKMSDFEHDPPAGQHFSWVTIHDPQMTKELARIRTEWAIPFAGEFSADGKWLYAAYRSTNKIAVFDVEKRALARTIETSVAPTGLALSNDGQEMYVTCLFSRPTVIQVIDVKSGEIKVSLGVPPSPSLVITDPFSGLIYVTATGSNMALEIDTKAKKLVRQLATGNQPLALVLSR